MATDTIAKSEMMGLHSEQLAGRTQQRFFSAEEAENFTYPGAFEVDFAKAAEFDAAPLSIREINLKLRELMSQGFGSIALQEPGREARHRGRHPQPAEPRRSTGASATSAAA